VFQLAKNKPEQDPILFWPKEIDATKAFQKVMRNRSRISRRELTPS